MIKLSYDDHLNLDFLREKMDQLREAVKNLGSPEDKEKVKKLVENLSTYLNKGIGAIQGRQDPGSHPGSAHQT